ncbi:MAG: tetratricopeptide repeat protein, partial [Candidatus Nitrosotenuis sp.]|nr:tetratricopeptide repeat protein [Candidatus Nitrosotenuis sp.]
MDPRRGQLLPSILVLMPILFVTVPVFAEEIITLETDAEAYFTGDVMIISGHVPNWKMPVIAMSIFDPDGDILSANNVEIEDDGTFTRIVTLDSPFYDKTGIYLITVDYGKNSAFTVFEVFSDQTNNEPVLPPSKIIPEVTSLKADKNSYHTDEFIMITGTVSAIAEPTVLVGIYNPDGSPASFYTAQIDQNLNFSAKFLAKSGINFKTFGTYSVKAHYANTKLVTTFDFLETSMNADVPMQNDKASSNETVSNADKQVPENTPKTGT